MMTTGESGRERSKYLQCLVFAESDYQHGIVQNFLSGHGDRDATKLDEAATVPELLEKLEQKSYDLLLIAHDVSEPQAAMVVEQLKSHGKRVPLLFLPESLVEQGASGPRLKGDSRARSQQGYSKTWLSRTVRSAALFASAEQQERRAEDTVRTLYRAIEQAADLVVITDSVGIIEYVNPAFEKLTGYTRAEAIGQTPRILKSGEQSAELYRDLWHTIRAGEIFRGVLVNRKKSGESFIVEKTITPVRNADGQVAHFISNDRDISERRRLESALFQAQKMDAIGQLAGGVAHDFNNLLMVISSYAELMLDTIGPEHRCHRNVQEVLSASRRAADLTRQLLAFGRKQMQSLQVLNLNTVLGDISRMLPRLIGEDVDLVISPQAELGRVKLDPVQIEQVVMNLVANARDAMPQGGKLTIATRDVVLDGEYLQTHPVVPSGRYVLLEVTDTGQGIDPLHLPHIFEPFYTTKENGKGTGLGLATVYGIVKQSGGFIWVYSEPGMGTTFKVYFPRIEAKARKPLEEMVALDASKLRGTETVLLVEDENAVRHPTLEFLRQCGYTVIEAKDGLQAIEVAHKHQGTIHMMVTDVVMPGMSGGQLAELLAERYSEMKVLFVSGYSEQVVLRHKIADVHTNFLQKPFTLKSLAAKMREILDATSAAAVAGAGH
jgi:two-component system, cell cycle sensor histidine kinase and response regulator CckA